MKKSTRILVATAALSLGLLYWLPLWKITLEAPQYPEGIGMRIHVNTITGVKPHDLQNINGLNHYIGMARIEPDSIPELRFMPWIVGGLIVVGLVAALAGRRRLLVTYAVVFGAAALAGLGDFWRWEYDYGHNLDPSAAIKVPGMSYQPPLLGSQQLLNFTANSWPAAGGWIAILAFLTVVALAVIELRSRRHRLAGSGRSGVDRAVALRPVQRARALDLTASDV
ncbi:MAG: hypothetical protein L0271_07885 [Gemmatimonadetes bacterium]|nr:hypothetical protein [Gemmatimonadota bacterium]